MAGKIPLDEGLKRVGIALRKKLDEHADLLVELRKRELDADEVCGICAGKKPCACGLLKAEEESKKKREPRIVHGHDRDDPPSKTYCGEYNYSSHYHLDDVTCPKCREKMGSSCPGCKKVVAAGGKAFCGKAEKSELEKKSKEDKARAGEDAEWEGMKVQAQLDSKKGKAAGHPYRKDELQKKSPPGRKEEVEKLKAKGLPASEAFGIAWKQHDAEAKKAEKVWDPERKKYVEDKGYVTPGGGDVNRKLTPRRPADMSHLGVCKHPGCAKIADHDGDHTPTKKAELEKHALTAAGREHIKSKNFALPGKRYPIEDKGHAEAAESMVSRYGTPAEKKKVDAAVHRKYPDMGKGEGDKFAKVKPAKVGPVAKSSADGVSNEAPTDKMSMSAKPMAKGLTLGPRGGSTGGASAAPAAPPPPPPAPPAPRTGSMLPGELAKEDAGDEGAAPMAMNESMGSDSLGQSEKEAAEKTCPTCKGKGEVPDTNYNGRRMMHCSECDGTGKLKKADLFDPAHQNDREKAVRQERGPGSVVPGDRKPKVVEAEGSGGQIKRSSVAGLRKAAMDASRMRKADAPSASVPRPLGGSKLPAIRASVGNIMDNMLASHPAGLHPGQQLSMKPIASSPTKPGAMATGKVAGIAHRARQRTNSPKVGIAALRPLPTGAIAGAAAPSQQQSFPGGAKAATAPASAPAPGQPPRK